MKDREIKRIQELNGNYIMENETSFQMPHDRYKMGQLFNYMVTATINFLYLFLAFGKTYKSLDT